MEHDDLTAGYKQTDQKGNHGEPSRQKNGFSLKNTFPLGYIFRLQIQHRIKTSS
jgi:hypothetical protein